jgi:hypothetical protein
LPPVLKPVTVDGDTVFYEGGGPGVGYAYYLVDAGGQRYRVKCTPSVSQITQVPPSIYVQEKAVSGSRMKPGPYPKYIVEIIADGVTLGLGFRHGNELFTAAHVLKDPVEALNNYEPDPDDDFKPPLVYLRGTRPDGRCVEMDMSWPVTLSGSSLDAVGVEVPPHVWAYLGVGSAAVGSPLRGQTCSVFGRDLEGRPASSSGPVSTSASVGGTLAYRASTQPGWSGSPIVAGRKVVGIHTGYRPEENLNRGVSLHFLQVDETDYKSRIYRNNADLWEDTSDLPIDDRFDSMAEAYEDMHVVRKGRKMRLRQGASSFAVRQEPEIIYEPQEHLFTVSRWGNLAEVPSDDEFESSAPPADSPSDFRPRPAAARSGQPGVGLASSTTTVTTSGVPESSPSRVLITAEPVLGHREEAAPSSAAGPSGSRKRRRRRKKTPTSSPVSPTGGPGRSEEQLPSSAASGSRPSDTVRSPSPRA